MHRIVLLVAVVLGLSLGTNPIAAQDGSPVVGSEAGYTDPEGAEALVTVTEVADPFEDYDPAYPPAAGSRFVLLTVAFENAGQRPFEANPYNLLVQDADGYLWGRGTVYRPDDAVMPELDSQTLAPGNRVSGVVGFVVPEAAELANVYYQPESGRLILLADLLPGAAPSLGDEVSYADAEGGTALVSVAEVVDPFEAFDPNYPPAEGGRYVELTVTFENSGERAVEADPSDVVVRDADGYAWNQTGDPRAAEDIVIPQLQSQQMAPGNRVSGTLYFVVPADRDVAGVYYQPESSRLIQLADLAPGIGASPKPESGADETDETPAASSATASEDCVGIEAWLQATADRIERASEMSREDATLEDIEALADHAAEYAELAAAQRAETVPPAAAAVNRALVATLNAYADSLEQILSVDEPGKDPAVELAEAANTFNEAATRLGQIQDQLIDVATECGLT